MPPLVVPSRRPRGGEGGWGWRGGSYPVIAQDIGGEGIWGLPVLPVLPRDT